AFCSEFRLPFCIIFKCSIHFLPSTNGVTFFFFFCSIEVITVGPECVVYTQLLNKVDLTPFSSLTVSVGVCVCVCVCVCTQSGGDAEVAPSHSRPQCVVYTHLLDKVDLSPVSSLTVSVGVCVCVCVCVLGQSGGVCV